MPPPLDADARSEFDPGDEPFGLWVSNDGLADGGVYSEPSLVQRLNKRLAKQPYKAMIYPNRDKATGKLIPNSYLIGWEYSTNDDFQDVVCQLDNVILIEPAAKPAPKGVHDLVAGSPRLIRPIRLIGPVRPGTPPNPRRGSPALRPTLLGSRSTGVLGRRRIRFFFHRSLRFRTRFFRRACLGRSGGRADRAVEAGSRLL